MLTKCFIILVGYSFIYVLFFGDYSLLTGAILDGAAKSVSLSLELCGMMCLWCGIMRVFRDAGVLQFLSRVMSPILKHVFPTAWRTGVGKEEITAAVSANLLGIGNAATPYALAAMKSLDGVNPTPDKASGDMVTFAVLGCASINLIPTTLITLLRSAGMESPYSIIVPIWICSFICAVSGILLSRLFTAASVKKSRKKEERNG